MKAVCKKLFSLMLVAILLVSAVPFQASAEEVNETAAVTEAATEAATEATTIATEAAVVAAAADEADEEISADSPEAYAGVELETGAVYVDFQLEQNEELALETTYRVDVVKGKLGKSVSAPSSTAALNVLKKAIGSVDCVKFVRWYYLKDGEKATFTSSTVLNMNSMNIESRDENEDGVSQLCMDVYAEFQLVPAKITLDANGGTVSNTKHQVLIGKTYGHYADLPTPTKSGSKFLGWYKDGEPVDPETTVVNDLGKLTAVWGMGRYTVTFMSFAEGEWAAVDAYTFENVENKTILKTEYKNFPSTADIKTLFKATGYEIEGWEYSNDGGDTWKTFTAGKTTITGNTIIRPLYTKEVKLYANDDGNTTRYVTVTLGKRVPALPKPGSREFTEDGKTVNKAFVGWFTPSSAESGQVTISTRYDLSDVSKHPVYEHEMGDTFIAGWKDAVTIYLYIHTNGNTKEHTKLIKYYDVPSSEFKLNSLDLAELFPNYGKYDDKGDERYGWYNEAQWDNYCLGRHVNDTTEYVDEEYLKTSDVHEFYIMLIDNGNNASSSSSNGNSYNDNKATVDSSNPTTGDDIFVAVTIMAVSACAVLLIFMNKKRIFK